MKKIQYSILTCVNLLSSKHHNLFSFSLSNQIQHGSSATLSVFFNEKAASYEWNSVKYVKEEGEGGRG